MHIDHKAGEKLFVDYAGDKLAIMDPDSGKEQPVETFVAILAASELTYVEASATQTKRRLDPLQRAGAALFPAAAPRSSSRTTCAARSVAATPTNRASTPSSTRSPRTMG